MKELTRDTIAFLRQEGLIPKFPKAVEKSLPKAPPPPKQVEPAALDTCKGKSSIDESIVPSRSGAVIVGRSLDKQPQPKSNPALLVDAIRKHLPHIPIIEKIPQLQTVAILFEEEEELPFLTNLKNAITERFCPCDILLLKSADIQSFSCILTPKDLGHQQQIFLAKASDYQDNIEKKREIWAKICKTLSPKSS